MDELLEHLEKAKRQHQDSSRFLTACVALAWEKLDKYYSLTDTNPVLYAAVALHPGLKYDYFKYAWVEHPSWIDNAKRAVKQLWELQYKTRIPLLSTSAMSSTLPSVTINTPSTTLSSWRQRHIPVQPIEDELEEFTSTKSIISVENPREWWAQNQKDYPRLSQMALDILAIPAMSAEVERVFSSAGKPHIFGYPTS